jgi:hypothetical protein
MGRAILSLRDLPPSDRLPESYVLICPERSQVQYPSDTRCSLHDFFKPKVGNHAWFWNTFAIPIPDAQRTQRFHPSAQPDGKLSLLERLPSELTDILIDLLLEPLPGKVFTDSSTITVLALGLSSPVLYPRVLARIHKDYQKQIPASWAGKRIGFHGTESFIPDKHQMQYLNVPASAYTSGMAWFLWPQVNAEPEMLWHTTITSVRQSWTEINEKDWRYIGEDVNQRYMYPGDRTWVLRNLDTKQIVCSDSLVPPSKITHGKWYLKPRNKFTLKRVWDVIKPPKPDARVLLTLAQIFIILTAFTTTSNGHEVDHLFENGPWTACAFDVVTLEQHIASGEEGWEDISAKAVADVGHLRWCTEQCVLWHEARGGRKADPQTMMFYGRMRDLRREWNSWTKVE